MNGNYIARGRTVRRDMERTETGIKMGFPVCILAEEVPEEAAQEIADALNLHREHHPEQH